LGRVEEWAAANGCRTRAEALRRLAVMALDAETKGKR